MRSKQKIEIGLNAGDASKNMKERHNEAAVIEKTLEEMKSDLSCKKEVKQSRKSLLSLQEEAAITHLYEFKRILMPLKGEGSLS